MLHNGKPLPPPSPLVAPSSRESWLPSSRRLFRACHWRLAYLLKVPLSLEILTPASRCPHLQGADSIVQLSLSSKSLFISMVPLAPFEGPWVWGSCFPPREASWFPPLDDLCSWGPDPSLGPPFLLKVLILYSRSFFRSVSLLETPLPLDVSFSSSRRPSPRGPIFLF